jgi:hypothetical protein
LQASSASIVLVGGAFFVLFGVIMQQDVTTNLKDLRVSIDQDIQEAESILKHLHQVGIVERSIQGQDEIIIAIIKLKEAKMWSGQALGAIGSKLPEQYRDEYKS